MIVDSIFFFFFLAFIFAYDSILKGIRRLATLIKFNIVVTNTSRVILGSGVVGGRVDS